MKAFVQHFQFRCFLLLCFIFSVFIGSSSNIFLSFIFMFSFVLSILNHITYSVSKHANHKFIYLFILFSLFEMKGKNRQELNRKICLYRSTGGHISVESHRWVTGRHTSSVRLCHITKTKHKKHINDLAIENEINKHRKYERNHYFIYFNFHSHSVAAFLRWNHNDNKQ